MLFLLIVIPQIESGVTVSKTLILDLEKAIVEQPLYNTESLMTRETNKRQI